MKNAQGGVHQALDALPICSGKSAPLEVRSLLDLRKTPQPVESDVTQDANAEGS